MTARGTAAAAAVLVLSGGAAAAPPPTLESLIDGPLERVEAAAAAARSRDPSAVQVLYDAARNLQLTLARRRSPECPALQRSLARYAAAQVRATEAFDRLRPTLMARQEAAAQAALAGTRREAARCGAGTLVAAPRGVPFADAERRAASVLTSAPVRAPHVDAALEARLAAALRGFDGYAAAWVHDLRSGRAAGVAADELFPAASTVKLGLLVATLARFGTSPRIEHDLEAMTAWSSNLAANRLRGLVGGDGAIEATLRRLGAGASTYTGPYRAGTSRTAPPVVSSRVTTARDLGRVLAALHGAAVGRRADLRATGLTAREARIAVGLLMGADDAEGALVPSVPSARKHGWLRAARHTGAILYAPRGPVVTVLLTYREGLTASEAQRLGRRVLALALDRSA